MGHWSRGVLAPIFLALVLAVPPGLPATAVRTEADAWPPPAWTEGRVADLTLLEQVLLLYGERPGTATAIQVATQLAALDRMDPVYARLARQAVAAMAEAAWHQSKALEGLGPAERAALAAGSASDPQLAQALAHLDQGEVAKGLGSLLQGSQAIAATLRDHAASSPPGSPGPLQQALAAELGAASAGLALADTDPASLARLASLLAGAQASVPAASFAGLPEPVRAAVGGILQASLDLKQATGPDPGARVLRLAASIDAAAPVLRSWRALTLAHQLAGRPDLRLPDPAARVPDLGWGSFDWSSRPVEAVPFPKAIREVAASLLPGLEDKAERRAQELQATLTEPQQEALARFYHALHLHIQAQQRSAPALDPASLLRWDEDWEAGEVPASGSQEEEDLLASLPGLEAAGDAEAAADALWDAAASLVPAFTQPASASPVGCVQPPPVLSLLALDACGEDSRWEEDALLLVDTGGNDTYTARLGAPFLYSWPSDLPTAPDSLTPLVVPFAFTLDLGGSDLYNTTQDCAQGAACPDLALSGQDPTGLARRAPASALVDWQGDNATAANTFRAGSRSQGFYAPSDSLPASPQQERARAILVERAGVGSNLTSSYQAMDRSQGSAVNDGQPNVSHTGGSGLLLRTVGTGSVARATFQARDASQGASSLGSLQGSPATFQSAWHSLGALLNVADSQAVSDDHYKAGLYSQASIASTQGGALSSMAGFADAFLLDVAGPGGGGDDTYLAEDFSRGYIRCSGERVGDPRTYYADCSDLETGFAKPHRPMHALFLDISLPRASPSLPPVSPGTEVPGHLVLDPSVRLAAAGSDDRYGGTIQPGHGYGWSASPTSIDTVELVLDRANQPRPFVEGGFYDILGDDAYDLHPGLWADSVGDANRPGNGKTWRTGADVEADDHDGDGYLNAAEELWSGRSVEQASVWHADPTQPDAAPAPVRSFVALDQAQAVDLDGSWALVLALGADDRYGPSYSATLHVDVGGKDTMLGRPGAAGGLFSDVAGPLGAAVDPRAGPPLAQHGLSAHIDLGGNDAYRSAWPRTQGYGEAGGTGLLFDLGGSDLYAAPTHAQGSTGASPTLDAAPAIGILADIGTPAPVADGSGGHLARERNVFEADRDTSQGQGHPGGLAVLLATGAHNTFRDGASPGLNGATLNLGDNGPPAILGDAAVLAGGSPVARPDGQPYRLEAGVDYLFQAVVQDPDGDPVWACFTFSFGHPAGGTADEELCAQVLEGTQDGAVASVPFRWNETHQVHSNAQDAALALRVPYPVRVLALDTGGASSEEVTLDVEVANPPPRLLPFPAQQTVLQGAEHAYQVGFQPDADLADPVVEVVWGDEGSLREVVSGDGIDWARSKWGARAFVPDAVPRGRWGERGDTQPNAADEALAIDGKAATAAVLRFDPESFPPIHLFVDFGAPRHVGRIRLDAQALGAPLLLSVEGITPDGKPVPLDQKPITGQGEIGVALPQRPLLAGIALRQLLPSDPSSPALAGQLNVRSIEAWGPGASHVWSRPGTFQTSYTILDGQGGRNATSAQVTVAPAASLSVIPYDEKAGDIQGLPLRLVDAFGAGISRHLSLGVWPMAEDDLPQPEDVPPQMDAREVDLILLSLEGVGKPCGSAGGVCLAIDWGDGSVQPGIALPDQGDQVPIPHRFTTAGEHVVRARIEADSVEPTPWSVVTHVHAETGLDLRVGEDPFLFIALGDGQEPGRTWHAVPHRATIDGQGNDLYVGPVGAARPLPGASPSEMLAWLPGLAVDGEGDDDYLSTVGGTQGFGTLAAAGLLLDAQGDDRYVLPATGLGACLAPPPGAIAAVCGGQGAGTRGGAGALLDLGGDDAWNPLPPSHPLVQDALPDHFAAWAARPAGLQSGMAPASQARPDLVQGAGYDGLGVFLAWGGADSLAAGSLAQGFGGHDRKANALADYVTPGDLDNCGSPQGGSHQRAFSECVTGVELRTLDQVLPPPVPRCIKNPLVGVCTAQNTDALMAWLQQGPRFGPGAGLAFVAGVQALQGDREAQGASEGGGRGVLASVGGGLDAVAAQQAQAFTSAGQALLVATGPHRLVLGSRGQGWAEEGTNPEATPPARVPTLALYAGAGDDASCGGPCGGPLATPTAPEVPPCLPQTNCLSAPKPALAGSLQLPPVLEGPAVRWQDQDTDLLEGGTYSLPAPLKLRAEAVAPVQGLEGVLLATVFGQQGEDGCGGPRLAGPILVGQGLDPQGQGVDFLLDPAAAGPSGPLLPAGCLELRAYLRNAAAAGIPTSGWSPLQGSIAWLPPPVLRLHEGSALHTKGGSVDINLVLDEPLATTAAALASPAVAVSLVKSDGTTLELPAPTGSWSLQDTPSGPVAVLPYQLDIDPAAGDAVLRATSAWSGQSGGSDIRLADILVDVSPPSVTLQEPLRPAWRGSESVVVRGEARDPSGVASLEFRLILDSPACRAAAPGSALEASCTVQIVAPYYTYDTSCQARLQDPLFCVLEVVPSFPPNLPLHKGCPADTCSIEPPTAQPGVPRQAPSVAAPLWALDGDRSNFTFEVPLRSTSKFADGSPFLGGPVLVQTRARDGWSQSPWGPWQGFAGTAASDLPTPVLLDKAAPRLVSIRSGLATGATSAFHPVPLSVVLEDCALDRTLSPDCGAGSGIRPSNVNVLVRDAASRLWAMPAERVTGKGGAFFVEIPWEGSPQGPPEGRYEIIVQARDNASNLLSRDRGFNLTVDRTAPQLDPGRLAFDLPAGQKALKPGDRVAVAAAALDAGAAPSGILDVSVLAGTSRAGLADQGNGSYAGAVQMPASKVSSIRLRVTAIDQALNEAIAFSRDFPFHADPPAVVGHSSLIRAESIDLFFGLDRDADLLAATLLGPQGPVQAEALGDARNARLRFSGLAPLTTYDLDLRVRDSAGHVVDLSSRFGALQTLPRANAAVRFANLPEGTVSGTVEVAVEITNPMHATLDLSVQGLAIPSVQVTPSKPVHRFTLDTLGIPASRDGAVSVPLRVVLDDGAASWQAQDTLRVDNHPPTLRPVLQGPSQHASGWHNATVPVLANATDDTGPVRVLAWLDGALLGEAGSVAVSSEGRHRVTFQARDGAVPPNEAPLAVVDLAIDRTLPDLQAFELPAAARGPLVPVGLAAEDPTLPDGPGSGLAGFRVRAGASWSDWLAQPPSALNVSALADGRHAVDVQVRDRAGNVRTDSRLLVVDRAPPTALVLQWIGRADQQPVLEFILADGNPSVPGSGVADVQWVGADGSEGPWTAVGTVGALAVEAAQPAALRLRDRAGNVGTVALPGLASLPATQAEAQAASEPGSGLLRDPLFAPLQGPASRPFTFSVVAYAWQGVPPDRVELVLGSQRHALAPTGPDLDGDGRLYTAQVALAPTRVAQPHQFHFEATYGTATVRSLPQEGPLVTSHTPVQGAQAALVPLHLLLAALAAAALSSRERGKMKRRDPK